jgi:Transposase IS116/IS110/IS902 family
VLAALELPPVPRQIVDDCGGLIDTLATPTRPVGATDQQARQARPARGGAHGAARDRPAHGHDTGRRDRRHRSLPSARKLCAWAGLTPAVRNFDRKVRHGPVTKQGSPWARWVLQEAAQRPGPVHRSSVSMPRSPPSRQAARHRRRRPQVTGPFACTSSSSCRQHRSSRQHPNRRRSRPGALAVTHAPTTRPLGDRGSPARTDRHADPPSMEARMGACETNSDQGRPGLLAARSCAGPHRRQGRSSSLGCGRST